MGKNRQEAGRRKTKEIILRTAADIFAEVGFDGARVDEIAERADVNKATIYYHIGDKNTLYTETLNHVFGQLLKRLLDNIKVDHPPEKKLQAYIRSLFETAEKNPHMPPIMMREVASGGRHFPEAVISYMTQILEILAGIIEDGTRQGKFIQTPPFLVHLMIIGTFMLYKTSGKMVFQHVEGSKELQDKFFKSIQNNGADEIEKLVLNAIKK